jgi:adenosylcobinamide-GDP ribazoletransferase
VLLATGQLWSGPLPALLAVATGVLVTGGFHEDGLADTADGLGGGQTPARRLEIMKDSRVGTYGVLALGLVLAIKVAALATLPLATAALALVAAHGAGRVAAVVVMVLGRHVSDRDDAKYKPAPDGVRPFELLIAAVLGLWPLACWAGPAWRGRRSARSGGGPGPDGPAADRRLHRRRAGRDRAGLRARRLLGVSAMLAIAMTLLVCPLSQVETARALHRPSHLISLLSPTSADRGLARSRRRRSAPAPGLSRHRRDPRRPHRARRGPGRPAAGLRGRLGRGAADAGPLLGRGQPLDGGGLHHRLPARARAVRARHRPGPARRRALRHAQPADGQPGRRGAGPGRPDVGRRRRDRPGRRHLRGRAVRVALK